MEFPLGICSREIGNHGKHYGVASTGPSTSTFDTLVDGGGRAPGLFPSSATSIQAACAESTWFLLPLLRGCILGAHYSVPLVFS